MRRALLCLWLCGCGIDVREPSPAAVPFRPIVAPGLPDSPVDPAVFAAAVRAGVRQRSANEAVFEVDAFLAALTVEDLRSGRPSVTMTPVLVGEQQAGYRVSGVREGSVYAAIGLLDGDVIEAINGVPLDAPQRALDALAGSERGAVLQVLRGGVGGATELRVAGGLAWEKLLALRGGAAGAVPEDRSLETAGAGGDGAAVDGPGGAGAGPESSGSAGTRGSGAAGSVGARGSAGSAGSRGSGSAGSPGAGPGSAGSGGGGSTRPGASTPAGTRPSSGAGVECAADGSCSVSRREFDAMVDDPGRLARQVQVSPTNGGYRLSGVRAGSDVSKLGFRNGDVLRAVNGTQLDDDFGLIGLYAGLATTRTYNVTFERGGVRRTRTIRLRD